MTLRWLMTLALVFVAFAEFGRGDGIQLRDYQHPMYLCNDAGLLQGGLRIQRTLDFALCRNRQGEAACAACKCEWLRYWESASACFELDAEYKIRLEENRDKWLRDYSEFCLDQEIQPEEEPPLDGVQFSLDPTAVNYCNGASAKSANLYLFGLVLLLRKLLLD